MSVEVLGMKEKEGRRTSFQRDVIRDEVYAFLGFKARVTRLGEQETPFA